MNIQFMTEENKKVNKKGRTVFVPNYEALIENACCDEEIEAIKNCKAIMEKLDDGFAFQIVHTVFTECLDYDIETHKQEWVKRWTVYQHPWYIENGKRVEKSKMISDIANEQAKIS